MSNTNQEKKYVFAYCQYDYANSYHPSPVDLYGSLEGAMKRGGDFVKSIKKKEEVLHITNIESDILKYENGEQLHVQMSGTYADREKLRHHQIGFGFYIERQEVKS